MIMTKKDYQSSSRSIFFFHFMKSRLITFSTKKLLIALSLMSLHYLVKRKEILKKRSIPVASLLELILSFLLVR